MAYEPTLCNGCREAPATWYTLEFRRGYCYECAAKCDTCHRREVWIGHTIWKTPYCRKCWDWKFDESRYVEWRRRAAENCRRQAAAWGVMHPGGDYAARLPVVEVLREPGPKSERWRVSEVEIIHHNGLWSFALDLKTGTWGSCYGPLVTNCPPCRTRAEAVKAAAAAVIERARAHDDPHSPTTRQRNRRLIRWAESLTKPQQATLF